MKYTAKSTHIENVVKIILYSYIVSCFGGFCYAGVVSLQTQRDSMEEPAKSKELVFLMLTSYLMNLGECSSEDSLQPEDFEHISRLVTKLSTLCEEDSDSIASTSADALSKTALQVEALIIMSKTTQSLLKSAISGSQLLLILWWLLTSNIDDS